MIISKKKPFFPISKKLNKYLIDYGRKADLPLKYEDLLHSDGAFPLLDNDGEDTLWETKMYNRSLWEEINYNLTFIYLLLKLEGQTSKILHLKVDRIDYCTFGNSKPFRIRIINEYNDNYDYFYVKKIDASRIYGLELEHILSPNRINYLVDDNTLIEEHIAGIPGDQFMRQELNREGLNKVRLAKEFIKFNERCFVKLLGDMRSYNYVIDITRDFDAEQYRIRAIDFDQQCYEGQKNMYLPQFFKENYEIVQFCIQTMNKETTRQYQLEERTLMKKRFLLSKKQLDRLLKCIKTDKISVPEKVVQLAKELNKHHKTNSFDACKNMGEILYHNMQILLNVD
jgi:hypothetical protein